MPGPLPGQTVTAGTIFGINQYGTSLYGIGLPPEYLVEPMTAVSISYTALLVTWNPPSGTIFRYRLLRNRYGFPVNENDGDLIYDTTDYPGNSYTDLDISPGTYHYYGFYVLVDIGDNIWVRSGFAGCLAIQDFGSGQYLLDLLPEYFTTIPQTGAALTDDAAGNSQLQLFLNVLGWGLDYLRTQYATYADHLNDATFVPLDDLWNLAQQVGLTFSPDVPAYTVRKATENFAHVAQQRGTLGGIAEEIALRTGYGADVHMGPNLLLDDDQAQILSPVFLQYQPARSYGKDECCWVPYAGQAYPWLWNGDGWWFRSLIGGNLGNTPPSGGTSNSYWQALYDSNDFLGTQGNAGSSGIGTWEVLDTGATGYLPLANSITQGLGVLTPPVINGTGGTNAHAWNCLRIINQQATSRTLWCRSVSRTKASLGQIPDSSFELGTTIAPVNTCSSISWVPQSWPLVTIENWMGGRDQVSVPAYWTVTNATVTRTDSIAHTGSWALQITPSGTAAPVTAPSAVQYPNPGFEAASLAGITPTQCTVSQSSAAAHSGGFSLLVAPDYYITLTYSAGEPSGNKYNSTGNPFVVFPQITAIAGASDTVSVYAEGVEGPLLTSAYPYVLAGIQYYDINGNVLATTFGTSAQLSGTWTQLTATATAPAGAVSKALIVSSDPAHAADINNWYIDDISWSWTVSESWSAVQLNSPWISCPPSTACTASIWYQAAAAGSTVTAELVFYDASGNVLATDAGSPVTGTASTWVNATASGTSPAGSAYAAINLIIASPVTTSYLDDTVITAGITVSTQPDQINAVQDGIPVPWTLDSQAWNPAIRYITNDIVQYDGQPFTALRASTGSVPPGNNVATTDWAPLSQSPRIRLCLSGYTSQNLTSGGSNSYAVTPFIEWYDQQGNFITRVLARSAAGNGTVSQPNDMAYDSFTTESVIASGGVSATTAALGPWNATFWDNTALSGTPVLTRVDPAIDFTWDGTAPGYGVASSGWSASWVTAYTAPAAGSYGFTLAGAQGGTRLIVNGQTIIDNWAAQSSGALTASVTLTAGQVITVEVDYYNPQLDDYSGAQASYGTITTYLFYPPWVSGQFAVAPRQDVTITGTVKLLSYSQIDTTVTGVITVTWKDISGRPVGTSKASYNYTGLGQGSTGGGPSSLSYGQPYPFRDTFSAPDGTSYATITLSVTGSAGPGDAYSNMVSATWGDLSTTIPSPLPVNSDALVFSSITVPAIPSSATQFSSTLAGRLTDDEQSNWTCPAGSWTVGGFAGGSAWPASPGTRSIGLLTTQPANTSLGVTYRSLPQGGIYAGIIFRYSSTANYWRADQTQLGYVSGGIYTLVSLHAQAFLPGDRMTITLNGTSITVYRNGTQVSAATSSFNESATGHGIINDTTASTEAGANEPARKPARSRTRMPPRRGHHTGLQALAGGVYSDTYGDAF